MIEVGFFLDRRTCTELLAEKISEKKNKKHVNFSNVFSFQHYFRKNRQALKFTFAILLHLMLTSHKYIIFLEIKKRREPFVR
jgi:hypothetical protein